MKRNKIIAGNWKMNKLYEEGLQLAEDIVQGLSGEVITRSGHIPLVILAPPVYLLRDVALLTQWYKDIDVAAQNAAAWPAGAFTGEVSAAMIGSAGASYVIIGHSERRAWFGEDDAILKEKVIQVISAGLHVIFCVGEVLQERMDCRHFDVVRKQLQDGLFHLEKNQTGHVIVAYEPVWAIGTGHNATPDQAQEMHRFIRDCLTEKYNEEIASTIPILYGGSCKPDNAAGIFAMPDVDGGLIGGASLNAADFIAVVKSI